MCIQFDQRRISFEWIKIGHQNAATNVHLTIQIVTSHQKCSAVSSVVYVRATDATIQ